MRTAHAVGFRLGNAVAFLATLLHRQPAAKSIPQQSAAEPAITTEVALEIGRRLQQSWLEKSREPAVTVAANGDVLVIRSDRVRSYRKGEWRDGNWFTNPELCAMRCPTTHEESDRWQNEALRMPGLPPLENLKWGQKLPEPAESSQALMKHAVANLGKVKPDEPAALPPPNIVAAGPVEPLHFHGPDFFAACNFFNAAGTPIVIAKSPRGDRLAFSFAEGDCHVVPLETVESMAVLIGHAEFDRMVAREREKAAARIASAAIAKAAARKL